MSAYTKLVPAGKRACDALGQATSWSREEWARSIRTLERAGLFPEIGLEQVYSIVEKTNQPPDDIAHLLVDEAKKYVAEKAQARLDENRTGLDDLLPPTHPNGPLRYQAPSRAQLNNGIDVSRMLADLPAGARVTIIPTEHEITTVCHSRHRDYRGAPHLHDCGRLSGHEDELHRCSAKSCGNVW